MSQKPKAEQDVDVELAVEKRIRVRFLEAENESLGDIFVGLNGREYLILEVPNIVDISYGRGVGYTFTEHDLGKAVHDISATKIRAEMREKGEL